MSRLKLLFSSTILLLFRLQLKIFFQSYPNYVQFNLIILWNDFFQWNGDENLFFSVQICPLFCWLWPPHASSNSSEHGQFYILNSNTWPNKSIIYCIITYFKSFLRNCLAQSYDHKNYTKYSNAETSMQHFCIVSLSVRFGSVGVALS